MSEVALQPVTERAKVVVGGFIGLLPAGGVAWDYVQYPLGLHELGHDVLYIEDTGLWPLYSDGAHDDCSENVAHLATVMAMFGLGDRWAYRDAITDRWFGRSEQEVVKFCRDADVFINVSCSTVMRDMYRTIPARALVDSDPMFTQIQYEMEVTLVPGMSSMRGVYRDHTHHFTFGELVNSPNCKIPLCDTEWHPTRQPIVLNHWSVTTLPAEPIFTTIMNWSATDPLQFAGRSWGQKNEEFAKLLVIPRLMPFINFRVAMALDRDDVPYRDLTGSGWQVVDAHVEVPDIGQYAKFIRDSLGELSAAKGAYVTGRTGWFSGRSACYLASGRPVIAQDTGWSSIFPTGEGLFAFSAGDQAIAAVREVIADPVRHSRAAAEIASAYFDSRAILTTMLATLGAA